MREINLLLLTVKPAFDLATSGAAGKNELIKEKGF